MAVPEAEEGINLSQVCENNLSLVHKGVRNGSRGFFPTAVSDS